MTHRKNPGLRFPLLKTSLLTLNCANVSASVARGTLILSCFHVVINTLNFTEHFKTVPFFIFMKVIYIAPFQLSEMPFYDSLIDVRSH